MDKDEKTPPKITPRKRGRPKLIGDPKKTEGLKVLLALIRGGNFLEPSCRAAAVSKSAVIEAVNYGREATRKLEDESKAKFKEDQPSVDFTVAFDKAFAEAEVRHVANVRRSSEDRTLETVTEVHDVDANGATRLREKRVEKKDVRGNFQASKFFLSTRFPDRYSPKTNVSVEGRMEHAVLMPQMLNFMIPIMRRWLIQYDVPKECITGMRLDFMSAFGLSENDIRNATAMPLPQPDEEEGEEDDRSERESAGDGDGSGPDGGG